MKKTKYTFSGKQVDVYFDASFQNLDSIVDRSQAVLITDEHVFASHSKKFKNWNTIVLKPGESYKIQPTADAIIEQLIKFEADRKTVLIGIGGGVITDLVGYVAAVYMRGLRFGFVPTTLLAMVDASIGGKNGIDVGPYKNLVGTIRQPSFLFYDFSFLKTLPDAEWSNGFAEIIKHACIRDAALFAALEKSNITRFKKNKKGIASIVQRNVQIKSKIVQQDEFEQGDRKLLNFGHTLGHALETQYELTHGQAISLGMVFASWLSFTMLGFGQAQRISNLLEQYGLPVTSEFDVKRVFQILRMDKKRVKETMHFILLQKLGKGVIREVDINRLNLLLNEYMIHVKSNS